MSKIYDEMNEKFGIHVDYLSFTFGLKATINDFDILSVAKTRIEQLTVMLGYDLGEIYDQERAHNNYLYETCIGQYIYVRYCGENTRMIEYDDEGNKITYDSMQLELKGSGCRDAEVRGLDYIELFDFIIRELGGKCNRIDIDIDDMQGDVIDIPYIRDKIFNKKLYTCSWNNPPVPYGTVESGLSIEFGSRTKSASLELCIYDKALERRYRKDNTCESLNYWTRYEMRFKRERANSLVSFILDTKWSEFGDFARNQLYQMLDLKEPGKDSNIARHQTDKKWLEFLGDVSKCKFTTMKKKDSNIRRKMTWRDYSLTRMNLIFELSGCYDEDYNERWIDSSIARLYHEMTQSVQYFKNKGLDPHDLALINDWRAKNGKSILSISDVEKHIQDLDSRAEEIRQRYTLPF